MVTSLGASTAITKAITVDDHDTNDNGLDSADVVAG